MQLDIIGGAYTARSGSEDFETCVNFYLETAASSSQTGPKQPYSAKYGKVLYPTPGLTEFTTFPSGTVVRAIMEFDGVIYTVVDNFFYAVTTAGVASLKGTMTVTTQFYRPYIVTNGLQVCVVDNGIGYVYTIATGVFAAIADVNFVAAAPNYITFQDGYGIYNQPGTSTWWITNINNFAITTNTDFAAANTTNQDITAIISNRQQLYIFTPVGCEIWFNSGDPTFPFARKNTSYMTQGTSAPASLVSADNTLFFLTRSAQGDGFVVRVDGDSTPLVISTPAISNLINEFETINDAIGFAYQEAGHLFYVLTFPTANRTLVYDIAENVWHERRSKIDNPLGEGTMQGRFRGNCYAFLKSGHIVGDYTDGKLWTMSNDVYTEDGVSIYRQRATSHLWNDLKRLCIRSLTLDCQVGVGNSDDPEPLINLYLSKDGGYTYGAAFVASLGAVGEYTKRIKFNRLGTSRDFVAKITTDAAVKVVLLGASAEIEQRDS